MESIYLRRPETRVLQERLLEPLAASERKEFMRMMRVVIEANAELSTIPARD